MSFVTLFELKNYFYCKPIELVNKDHHKLYCFFFNEFPNHSWFSFNR